MSELVTIARPYAKAAFEFAVEQQNVANWQFMLAFSAEVSRNEQITKLLLGVMAPEKLAQKFIAICGETLDVSCRNLIRVMAENGRLEILPDVLKQFILLCEAQKKTAEVDIISISTLNRKQLTRIKSAMEQRLLRKVKLNCKIDKSIVAGIMIRAGDMVIDGSIRGRLKRLADVLQS